MKIKYQSLIDNHTWDLVDRTTCGNREVITDKWVFNLKKDRSGDNLKYKARWVHGYKQREGVDYLDTFAVVMKPVSYKPVLAISVETGYTIKNMDVVTAFLYELLGEDVFVTQLIGFEQNTQNVCKTQEGIVWTKTGTSSMVLNHS